MKDKKIITTKNWWSNFYLEYDRGDLNWVFDRIKTNPKGRNITLLIDSAYVCDDDNNRGMSVWGWFVSSLKSDSSPYGWVMDTYDESDRSEKAQKRAYVKGCKNILNQIK